MPERTIDFDGRKWSQSVSGSWWYLWRDGASSPATPDDFGKALEHIEELRAQLRAVTADAERWRAVKNEGKACVVSIGIHDFYLTTEPINPQPFGVDGYADALIAARASQPEAAP